MEYICRCIIEKIKIMKKIMVIVLASTMGSYAYAQSGNGNSIKSTPSIVKKNKSKKPPPPPPPPPPMLVENQLPPAPPALPAPVIIEESAMMAPPPPPLPPPPPPPFKKGSKNINKAKIQKDIQ